MVNVPFPRQCIRLMDPSDRRVSLYVAYECNPPQSPPSLPKKGGQLIAGAWYVVQSLLKRRVKGASVSGRSFVDPNWENTSALSEYYVSNGLISYSHLGNSGSMVGPIFWPSDSVRSLLTPPSPNLRTLPNTEKMRCKKSRRMMTIRKKIASLVDDEVVDSIAVISVDGNDNVNLFGSGNVRFDIIAKLQECVRDLSTPEESCSVRSVDRNALFVYLKGFTQQTVSCSDTMEMLQGKLDDHYREKFNIPLPPSVNEGEQEGEKEGEKEAPPHGGGGIEL
jgi:hypothetical protein